MSQIIFAERAWVRGGWQHNVRLTIHSGKIAGVETEAQPQSGDMRVDVLLPGLSNLHSHAFQRGMAGLAEQRGAQAESFWTWRDIMYRFALSLSPEEMQAVADMAYMEMLEQGFTRVGEFHYLHHDKSGSAYADPAEMSQRIFAAADNTGIALTHLPVFYAHSDFGGKAPHDGQRRFIHSLDDFLKLHQACKALLTRAQDRLGFAPHSLRAATGDEITVLLTAIPDGPVHIHISEQVREVEDSVRYQGQRPVEWLLEHVDVTQRYCLIHATHMTDAECRGVAKSGAVVGLCPITEANLGDGIFPGLEFLSAAGLIGIGSDSNVEITSSGELRLLEYGQRLQQRARNVLAEGVGSTGEALYRRTLQGGAKALGAADPIIAVGAPADLMALSDPYGAANNNSLLDRWIFSKGVNVAHVWAHGKQVVRNSAHIKREQIVNQFNKVQRHLLQRL